jgi:hypothetical protein
MKAGLILMAAMLAAATAEAQNAAQQAALQRLAQAHAMNSAGVTSGAEASTVTLNQPVGLAFDSMGDLFIADTDDHEILEVNLLGVVSVVAGTGAQGYSGDGGAATSAKLDSPLGVAVDSSGNVFIADSHNHCIREVSGGTITTIAGTGTAGFSGDGSAAILAKLDNPKAVAVDSKGNIYIADTDNNRIREIVSGTINTVAGNGRQDYSGDSGLATAAAVNSPSGVAVDSSFNIYIADTDNQRVRMVTYSTGIISTIAGTGVKGYNGDGTATATELARPLGVAVDASSNVYVADTDNDLIRELTGGKITTLAGNATEGNSGNTGSSTSAALDSPYALAVYSNQIAFSDTLNNVVQIITSGTLNTTAGTPKNGSETLTLGSITTTVYGNGSITATYSNNGKTGTGTVIIYDGEGSGPATVGSAALSSNMATVGTGGLSAGGHDLIASYAGDTNNAAVTSGVYILTVTPAPLTATANAVSLLYGQTIPTLTGTLSGVLSRDSSNVSAVYSTTATSASDPGTYPISAKLSGSVASNYTVAMSTSSGSVTIAKSPTATQLKLSNSTPIYGASLTLTANLTSTSGATPAGTVSFYNGTTLLNTTPATVTNGSASIATSSLPLGSLNLFAVYSGNTDFVTSTSATTTVTNISPDFSISASPSQLWIVPSQSVNYSLTLTPVNSTFVYPVSLSASGLPNGVTASFSPSSITTGASSTQVTMTLSASSSAKLERAPRGMHGLPWQTSLALLPLPLAFSRRFRRRCSRLSGKWIVLALLALVMAGTFTGCGGAGFFTHPQQSYTVTVTAVCGSNTHTSTVMLTVE